jgi:hypothetical protein
MQKIVCADTQAVPISSSLGKKAMKGKFKMKIQVFWGVAQC